MRKIPMQISPLNSGGSRAVQWWIYFWKWNQECEMRVFTLHFIHFVHLNFKFILCSSNEHLLWLSMFPFFHLNHKTFVFSYKTLHIDILTYKEEMLLNSKYSRISFSRLWSMDTRFLLSFSIQILDFLCFNEERERVNMIEILRVKRLHLFMCTFPSSTHLNVIRFISWNLQHKTRWHDTTRIIPTKGFRCWNEI